MENKTSYSWQDAKNEIAKNNGYSWNFICEAAELYKEKATEDLRKDNDRLLKLIKFETDLTKENLANKSEIEALKESNKNLRKEMEVAMESREMYMRQNAAMFLEIEHLTHSNKELVEALKTLEPQLEAHGFKFVAKDIRELLEKSKS